MRLLSNRVLVEIIDKEPMSTGGVFMSVDERPHVRAKVVLLGEVSQYGDWWVNVGDIVKIDNPKFAVSPMTEIEFEGKECLIINENDINI